MLRLRLSKKKTIILFGFAVAAVSIALVAILLSRPNKVGKQITSNNPSVDEVAGNVLVSDEQKAEYVEAKAHTAIQEKRLSEAEDYINELSEKYKYKEDNLSLMIIKARLYMRKGEFQQSVAMTEKIIQSPAISSNQEALKNWNEFLSYAKSGQDAYELPPVDESKEQVR